MIVQICKNVHLKGLNMVTKKFGNKCPKEIVRKDWINKLNLAHTTL